MADIRSDSHRSDVATGTRITCTDLATGESESKVIENDYIVITDGNRYVDGIQVWPKSGTATITVKVRRHV